MTEAQITQLLLELLDITDANIQVTQELVEIIGRHNPTIDTTQVMVEILTIPEQYNIFLLPIQS